MMALDKIVYKQRTEDELVDARQTLLNALWGRRHNGHVWSIPVDELRDVDCILMDGINELVKLRAEVEALKADAESPRDPESCPMCQGFGVYWSGVAQMSCQSCNGSGKRRKSASASKTKG